jgi:hypothetical protein
MQRILFGCSGDAGNSRRGMQLICMWTVAQRFDIDQISIRSRPVFVHLVNDDRDGNSSVSDEWEQALEIDHIKAFATAAAAS